MKISASILSSIVFLLLALVSINVLAEEGRNSVPILAGQDAVEYACGSTVTHTPPQLFWTDVPAARTYVVERSDDGAFIEIAEVAGLAFSDSSIDWNRDTWFYRVKAIKGNGNSKAVFKSNEIELRLLAVDCPPPAIP